MVTNSDEIRRSAEEHLDSAQVALDEGKIREAEAEAILAKKAYEKIEDQWGIRKCEIIIAYRSTTEKADDLLEKAQYHVRSKDYKEAKKLAQEAKDKYKEIDFFKGIESCDEIIIYTSKNLNYWVDKFIDLGARVGKITGVVIIIASIFAFGYLIWSAVYPIGSLIQFNLTQFNLPGNFTPPDSKEVFVKFARVIEKGLLVITILVIGAGVLSLLRRFTVEEKNIDHLKKHVISMIVIMMAIAMFEAFLSISKLDGTSIPSLEHVTLLVYISVAFGIVIASLGIYIRLTKEKEG